MKFTESPVNGRPGRRVADNMPLHLPGVLMSNQFQPYRSPAHHPAQTMPTLTHRTSSLEMLNNVNDFEEKRAFIASTLSLNDLLKSSSQEFRGGGGGGGGQPGQNSQFSPLMGQLGSHQPPVSNGYMVPQSLLKPNTNGYNVNFLNNGIPDKDLGKFQHCTRTCVCL